MDRIFVKDYTLAELEAWVESIGERRFRARQLFRQLYSRGVRSWNECSDLSKTFRGQLEHGTYLDALQLALRRDSTDGTRKYLFRLSDGLHIESVLIPDLPRCTLCISSQVGCALNCKFCLTGTLGLKRNLTVGEIVDQVCQVQGDIGDSSRITNIVLMGMGEPLANYDAVTKAIQVFTDPTGLAFSHRRVTLSTAGLVPQLRRLGEENPVNLAISLHAADDRLRSELMPINKKYGLGELISACKQYPLPTRKRITFEYILLERINDDPTHARSLAKLLRGIRCKVNLIPYNEIPHLKFRAPSEDRMLTFQNILQAAHLTVTIRQSRGADIEAACGQLVAKCAVNPNDAKQMSP